MKQVNFYITEEDKAKLDELCQRTSRRQSSMMRYLIRQAHDEMVSPRPEHRTVDAAAGYAAINRD